MLKAVIFDFDGTITDSLPLVIEEATKLIKEEGLEVKDIEYYRNIKFHSKKEIQEKLEMPLRKAMKLIFKVRRRVIKRYGEVELHPGMNELIKKLSKDYKIGILTSNYKKAVKIQQKKHGLDDHFNIVMGGFFWKTKKLNLLRKRLKLQKDEIIYIGDEVKDIIACQEAGIRIIAVTWGYNTVEALKSENPDFMVDKPKDILKVLNEIK